MKSARILLVEDDTDVLALNQSHLEGQNYEILGAKTLNEARNLLWEYPPDMVVLDVQMPDGSGFDFCEELRRISSAPVLFLTSMDGNENIVRGLLQGGDDYLTKPYSLDVMSARVHALLRRAGFGNAGRLELPPLIVDFLSGKAELQGEVIDLPQKQLQLLGFLASHAGLEFSAEQLYEIVWGGHSDGAAATVKTHITRLRHSLGMDGASPFELRATRNRGYMFIRTFFEPSAKS
jgi:DNA-binding response OmpR family regulator